MSEQKFGETRGMKLKLQYFIPDFLLKFKRGDEGRCKEFCFWAGATYIRN